MNNNYENLDALSSKAGERYSIDPRYYDKYSQ